MWSERIELSMSGSQPDATPISASTTTKCSWGQPYSASSYIFFGYSSSQVFELYCSSSSVIHPLESPTYRHIPHTRSISEIAGQARRALSKSRASSRSTRSLFSIRYLAQALRAYATRRSFFFGFFMFILRFLSTREGGIRTHGGFLSPHSLSRRAL